MTTAIWSAKGGNGASVFAAALALQRSSARPTTLVDLDGDLPAILGCTPPPLGIVDWLNAPGEVVATGLARVAHAVTDALRFLAGGDGIRKANAEHAPVLVQHLDDDSIIDCGTAQTDWQKAVIECCDERLMVVRNCYLSLARAAGDITATGVIVVEEPWRSITVKDIEAHLGLPVKVKIPFDAAIARSVDAGTLATRLPKPLKRALAPLADA